MKMTKTTKQIITGGALIAIGGAAALAEYFGIGTVKYLVPAVAILMMLEFIHVAFDINLLGKKNTVARKSKLPLWRKSMGWLGCVYFAFIFGPAAFMVAERPWIILLLLMIIAATDTGAWLFGRIIGGDKMWPDVSPNKTWAGQIAGVACGTFAAVLYGLLGTDTFMPQLMWIGISVALLSQYGDLLASGIKRKLGIKDFGNILPGHGGLLDRFDGWIFVLPIVWLVML